MPMTYKLRGVKKYRPKHGLLRKGKNELEYCELVLQEVSDTYFKPNSKILQTIKTLESSLYEKSKDQPCLTVLQIERLVNSQIRRRHDQNRTCLCSKCSISLTNRNHETKSTSEKVNCTVLGPLYCKKCSLRLKEKIDERNFQDAINYTVDSIRKSQASTNQREEAIVAIACKFNDGSLHVKTKNKPYLTSKKHAYSARPNTDENNSNVFAVEGQEISHRNARSRAFEMTSLKHRLTDVSKIKRELEFNSHQAPIKRFELKQGTRKEKTERDKQNLNSIKNQKFTEPPKNSRTTSIESPENEKEKQPKQYIKFYMPRTDLEWYEDISNKRKRELLSPVKNTDLNLIELSSKLVDVFQERNFPPALSHRTSSISSIDSISSTGSISKQSIVQSVDHKESNQDHATDSNEKSFSPPLLNIKNRKAIYTPDDIKVKTL